MSFYMMAFVLSFFTVAVWIIQGAAAIRTVGRAQGGSQAGTAPAGGGHDDAGAPPLRGAVDRPGNGAPGAGDRPRPRFKLNPPVVGILLGLLLAVTGWYDAFPGWVRAPFRWASVIALDAIMVVLGAVLASIPAAGLSFRREFGGLVLVKMLLYPLAVLGIMALIPLRGVDAEVASGIKLALVLEAAVPPATNVLVITKAYGTKEQVEYAGGAIVTTYAASLVLLPLFLIASRLVYG
jgi:predicted permease